MHLGLTCLTRFVKKKRDLCTRGCPGNTQPQSPRFSCDGAGGFSGWPWEGGRRVFSRRGTVRGTKPLCSCTQNQATDLCAAMRSWGA